MLVSFLAIAIAGTFIVSDNHAHEQAPKTIPIEKKVDEIRSKKLLTEEELVLLVSYVAEKHNVSSTTLLLTIKNEAKKEIVDGTLFYDATGKSEYPGEESYGLAQWNLPSGNANFEGGHITYAQATDPVYSVDLMASYFSKGKQNIWSGYRKLKST